MSVVFPDIPLYKGWGAPLRLESDVRDLEVVHGEVPRNLAGTLYRCGPDRQYPPLFKDDVFIDGEGMAHMFRFENGHVDYRSRWIRNERFLLQEEARRSLFGRYRNRFTNDPSVAGKSMGTANTNVVWHGKRLLILKEDSLPVELDPDTLATRGEWGYEGSVRAVSLTAHPKLDLKRNELLTYSFQAQGDCSRDFAFYIADASGHIVHETWLEMPYPCLVHDFGATDTHIIVPFFPLITEMDVIKAGGPFYRWHPNEQTHFAVIPRRGSHRDVQWFKGPAMSAGHMMNAFNEGSLLNLDVCLYQGNCFDFFPSADGSSHQPVPPQLTRLTFDLEGKAGRFTQKRLSDVACEMPRCDDRYIGRPYRYGYCICRSPSAKSGEMGMGAVGCFDLERGEVSTWSPGPNTGVHEPNFAMQAGPEGSGYLLVIVNRLEQNHSELAVLDARRVSDGPVALLRMPVRVRSTFHGMWVPERSMSSGLYHV